MTDIVDIANNYADAERERAIADMRANRKPGLSECEECGEPISGLRKSMGATLCIFCQDKHERVQ